MDKTLLKDLKRRLLIRSALISLPSLDELLSLNDVLSSDEILLEIIKKSLREFELSNPLVLDMSLNRSTLCCCAGGGGLDGYAELKSNFKDFLDCTICEGDILLVPNSIPKWRIGSYLTYPTAGSYTYFTDYRRPYLFVGDIPWCERLLIRGICSRPIVPDFTPSREFNENSERSAIYWMNIEDGARGNHFMDVCMMNLLDYIRQLKASIQLPNMSVDVLGNVDNAYMELRTRCEQYALQSSWYGDTIM